MDSPYDVIQKHELFLYPMARVRYKDTGGSATCIYSRDGHSYYLTNHHVIEKAVSIDDKWIPQAGREVKMETREEVTVESFVYEHLSWLTDSVGRRADIVAWDAKKDLALLELKSSIPMPHVAKLLPEPDVKGRLRIFDRVFAVGASLGEPPVITEGRLAGFHKFIDGEPFWLQTAPTIFGNSGGAVFLHETGELIGVPARVAVILIGFGGSAIPHMSWCIPVSTVYEFMREQYFQFIYDPTYTWEQCKKEREDLKRRALESMLVGKEKD